jgi:hypothetical protein
VTLFDVDGVGLTSRRHRFGDAQSIETVGRPEIRYMRTVAAPKRRQDIGDALPFLPILLVFLGKGGSSE